VNGIGTIGDAARGEMQAGGYGMASEQLTRLTTIAAAALP